MAILYAVTAAGCGSGVVEDPLGHFGAATQDIELRDDGTFTVTQMAYAPQSSYTMTGTFNYDFYKRYDGKKYLDHIEAYCESYVTAGRIDVSIASLTLGGRNVDSVEHLQGEYVEVGKTVSGWWRWDNCLGGEGAISIALCKPGKTNKYFDFLLEESCHSGRDDIYWGAGGSRL